MKCFTFVLLGLFSLFTKANTIEGHLPTLAQQYQVSHVVLTDYVHSYNFKCSEEITQPQLANLLTRLDEDTELSVMLESDKMQWRDLYVEARSLIGCFGEGEISRGY